MAEFTILVLAIGCILLVWVLWGMDTDFKKLKDENDVLRSEFHENFRKIVSSMPYSQRTIYDTYVTLDRLASQIIKAKTLRDGFLAKNDFESAAHTRKIIKDLEESHRQLLAKLEEVELK